jgi:catechol 2,3-dioxygenase-like lactoylglutathione lyase family enzyme
MPSVTGVLETALYVEDMERAIQFYDDLFAFRKMAHDGRFCAYDVAKQQVLLLFKRGSAKQSIPLADGVMPPHDGSGPVHMALAINANELAAWEQRLSEHNIKIESRIRWPFGGQSIYFRDPDRHLLELVTPGCWANY